MEPSTKRLQEFNEKNSRAWAEYYQLFYQRLFFFGRNITKDDQETEDIIAEIFGKIYRGTYSFDSFKGLTQFLYTSVGNAAFDFLDQKKRSAKRLQEYEHLSDSQEHTIDTSEMELQKAELHEKLLLAIATLPAGRKRMIELYYYKGYKAVEIAEMLKISDQAVYNQLNSARNTLREILKDMLKGLGVLVLFMILVTLLKK
jgi:RNA polymerase sigma-70 factor (ECF subfamily)